MIDIAIQNNHLSIELGGGFSFLLQYNRDRKSAEDVEILNFAPGTISGDPGEVSRLAQLPAKSLNLSWVNRKFVVIPDPLFQKDHARTLLELNCGLKDDEEVYTMPLPEISAQLVFASSLARIRTLQKKHPYLRQTHVAGHFLHVCMESKGPSERIHLSVYPELFLLCAFREGRMVFLNAYPHHSPEDVIYFLLYTCDQLALNPHEIPVLLSGEIQENDALFQTLSKYTGDLQFMLQPRNIAFEGPMKLIKPHRFLHPTDQFRCAL
jgi:hypothetical protein